jgi:hypothetical protein
MFALTELAVLSRLPLLGASRLVHVTTRLAKRSHDRNATHAGRRMQWAI